MPLQPNEQLGPYQILAPVGAGGMGEVYKARDSRLDRVVAIKVAREQFSERFEHEARAIAALNHSHVCQLYDVGPNYLVMEYIDGRPLAGPLPLEQALNYARQILNALAAAHQKGIVHRDLKPANILVTKSGVKLLDFGLARMGPAVSTGDETVTTALTGDGQILGTLHYMSPEQLHGQEAGPASDIFSFGLVFYEMLTGRRAFHGPSAASLIAAILEHEPPSLGTAAPPAVQAVLARCLAKDPEERWQSARDVRIALDLAGEVTAPAAAAARPRPSRWVYPLVAAAAVIAAVTIAAAHFGETKPAPLSAVFEIAMPEGGGFSRGPVISPDGTQVVFQTAQGLFARSMDSTSLRELPGTRVAGRPSWSPDSRHLAFVQMNTLKRMPLDGAVPQSLCNVPGGGLGPPYTAWGPDGSILFTGAGSGLWKVSASGGAPVKITTPPASGEVGLHMVLGFLPDGRHFLFVTQGSQVEKNGIYVGSLDDPPSQEGKMVLSTSFGGAFAPDGRGGGYLLFRKDGALIAQPFDLKTFRLTGLASTVASQVGTAGPLPLFSVSPTGVLVYGVNNPSVGAQLTWVDRAGKKTGEVGSPMTISDLSLSPDEKRLAYTMAGANNVMDIWLIDVAPSSLPRRFTFDPANFYHRPLWAPDGLRILFTSNRGFTSGGSYQKPVNGAGKEQRLEGIVGFPSDRSRDERMIVSTFEGDLWVWADGKSERLTQTPAIENMAQFSPNGKWIAYVSDETGRPEVWVGSYPATGAKYQVSTTGAAWPHWRSDGKELFYVSGRKMVAAAVRTDPAFEVGARSELFGVNGQRDYEVASNGARFLVQAAAGDPAPEHVTVMTNWLAVLKR